MACWNAKMAWAYFDKVKSEWNDITGGKSTEKNILK